MHYAIAAAHCYAAVSKADEPPGTSQPGRPPSPERMRHELRSPHLYDAHLHLRARRPPESARSLGQGHRVARAAVALGGLLGERARRAQQIYPYLAVQRPRRAHPRARRVAPARQQLAAAERRAPDPPGKQAVDRRLLLAGPLKRAPDDKPSPPFRAEREGPIAPAMGG